jgi:hypothetical protein
MVHPERQRPGLLHQEGAPPNKHKDLKQLF